MSQSAISEVVLIADSFIFQGLQVSIQPVLESIILIDRIIFLREAGIGAKLVPIFEDHISPRNLAIVAIK